MMHTFSPSTWEVEAGGISEFKVRLVCTWSSSLTGLQGETLPQKQTGCANWIEY